MRSAKVRGEGEAQETEKRKTQLVDTPTARRQTNCHSVCVRAARV